MIGPPPSCDKISSESEKETTLGSLSCRSKRIYNSATRKMRDGLSFLFFFIFYFIFVSDSWIVRSPRSARNVFSIVSSSSFSFCRGKDRAVVSLNVCRRVAHQRFNLDLDF